MRKKVAQVPDYYFSGMKGGELENDKARSAVSDMTGWVETSDILWRVAMIIYSRSLFN